MQFESLDVEVRRARRDDAQAIGAVFDAAVRAGWSYLGELGEKPMFAPHDWDQLIADHAPPNVLLVATDRTGRVLGYTAAHPEDGEMFLLFVHPAYAGRGVGRMLLSAAHDALRVPVANRPSCSFTSRTNGRWRSTRPLAIAPTDRFASRTSGALPYARYASSKSSETGGVPPPRTWSPAPLVKRLKVRQ